MGRRGWGLGGGRGATGAHLKSMGSYEQHAWRDALAIASLLDDMVGASKARGIYERISKEQVWKYEDAMDEAIGDFIGRSESQRPAVVRKLPDETTRVCFLTLAILGCVRAKDVMELRDRYRELLAPGRGNRETTRGLYGFANQIQGLFNYDWPGEVFESMGIDDDGESEADDRGLEASGSPDVGDLKPTIPPPPPPVQQRQHTEVLVTMGKSDTVAAAAGSEAGAWKVQLVQDESRFAAVTVLAKPLKKEVLLKYFVGIAGQQWGRLPTLLLFSESQRDLVDEINQAAGKGVAAIMRKGVTSLACMKWPEELMRSLKRELDLVGERMPTAEELGQCQTSTLSSTKADPVDGWRHQRTELEEWTKAILAHRGRWVGDAKAEESGSKALLSSAERDLSKAKRTVAKLKYANRTSYGDALFGISQALLSWRAGELSVEEAGKEAASAMVEYGFRISSEQGQGEFQLGYELSEFFGQGSAELDVLERGVLRLLNGPFESGRAAPVQHGGSSLGGYGSYGGYGAYGGSRRPRGWFQAWWCVLEAETPSDFAEVGKWLPTETAMADAGRQGMPQGITLLMSSGVCNIDREPLTAAARWVDAGSDCRGHGRQLISWIDRGGAFHAHDGQGKGESSCRRGVLVVAHGQSREQVLEARGAWATAAPHVEARIRAQDARGKRQAPPRSLHVASQSVDFFEDLVSTRERLALMSGRKWDGNKRRAVE